ncbi:pyruvate,orthophosphate dikinase [Rhizomicrobium palustre]|uniref:Pyruvate, phosphate dikinase n=1 Tax=Rhizomicrobium palustre TaxID=189966 RepID=A0A846N4M4_9PROT|nr:pyruvate, phosphate dikinase [Rhizomicrobium palustre]NIK90142.1 pyruvate,orthophosphate dikinase [Rhizomicrobium palustre]
MSKWVYTFGDGSADGDASMRNLLGGKGANLAEMSNLGLPVPPGFSITTEVCTYYYANNQTYPADLKEQVEAAVIRMGRLMDAKLGDPERPLLVSVRSGARVSMPGMMDTVLNLGLTPETVEGVIKLTNNPRFAWDSYRRFVQMYSNVVLGMEHADFEEILDHAKEAKGVELDTDLDAGDLKTVTAKFKELVQKKLGKPFPDTVEEQLWGGIGAVFSSWMCTRAQTYRRLNKIPGDWGTAVNVQAMVFGNRGDTSATGVAFTRDPGNGEKYLYGEYLINAQGEDVVAGIRTPQPITKLVRERQGGKKPSMEEAMPNMYKELLGIGQKLENHFKEMQDVEFTIQEGKLWMLQCRAGKRTAKAALKVAIDLVSEGLIDKKTAVQRVDPAALDQLLHPTLDPKAPKLKFSTGLAASPGAAIGEIVFTADEAEKLTNEGHDVILVRQETSPEDIHGMHAAKGILTARGGMTSHAAVVARGMGRPCVAGAGSIRIDYDAKCMAVGDKMLKQGDVITIDGSAGVVYQGRVPMQKPELTGDFNTLMNWADEVRELKVYTNADTPTDARTARSFGAQGIGLCRTEHMFFDGDRIVAVRQMILSETVEERERALAKLLPMQRGDFEEIFRVMDGLPVIIRLLDPPLHEFLPHKEEEYAAVAKSADLSVAKLKQKANQLHEMNPMLGHRGCRLGITFPEITAMQARAILEAALNVEAEGKKVIAEIMIPVVAWKQELDFAKDVIETVAQQVKKERGKLPQYKIGTMIELPRAALRAGDLAQTAEFFSFGTNDLTQTTCGISRDDAGPFLTEYQMKGLLMRDPFVTIDRDGVGELIKIAAERGRKTRSDLDVGICGEHGGDPDSIALCHEVGLNYVSCSPFRVPVARLAAAQAALKKVERDV